MWDEQTKLKSLIILRVHGRKFADKYNIYRHKTKSRPHSKISSKLIKESGSSGGAWCCIPFRRISPIEEGIYIMLFYKIVNPEWGKCRIFMLVIGGKTRTHNTCMHLGPNLDDYKYSFYSRIITEWNKFPSHLRSNFVLYRSVVRNRPFMWWLMLGW